MAYTPPAYNNIVIGVPDGVYTPPNYNNIIIGATLGIGRYALVIYSNMMVTISSALLGTGLQPLVLDGGEVHPRETTEGIPIVMMNNELVTLPEEDYLLI